MKKLLTIILVLALLLPVAACADESGVIGCWATYELLTTGAPSIIAIYLAPDHTCYYLAQAYHTDEPGLGRAYVGTWKLMDDGSVYAKIGENTSKTLVFDDTYVIAIDKGTNKMYINLGLLYKDW